MSRSGVGSERAALVALSAIPGIGPATLLAAWSQGMASRWWEALQRGRGASIDVLAAAGNRMERRGGLGSMEAAASRLDPSAFLDRHAAAGIEVACLGEASYPARLVDDPAPPAVVFSDGSLRGLDGPTVAIVGTRNATRLGCTTAATLAAELAECGVSIISGLALGIDGAAHRAVVGLPAEVPEAGSGTPIAVVATGLDQRYPRRHALLHDQVRARGGVISESPLGATALPWRFPARNRIIAALSDAVVVVESRSTGGSMLTASEALDRDVRILAVPGHPSAASSAGALDLICDGATPIRDTDDVLVAIGLGGRAASLHRRALHPEGPPLAVAESDLLAALEGGPRTLADLLAASGTDLGQVSTALVRLEDLGLVSRAGPWFERTGVSAPHGRTGGAR